MSEQLLATSIDGTQVEEETDLDEEQSLPNVIVETENGIVTGVFSDHPELLGQVALVETAEEPKIDVAHMTSVTLGETSVRGMSLDVDPRDKDEVAALFRGLTAAANEVEVESDV